MAGKTALALKQYDAMERIARVSDAMATELDVELAEIPTRMKQPDALMPEVLTVMADNLEAIATALDLAFDTEPEPEPPAYANVTRAELEAIAVDMGIESPKNPQKFPNKQALIDAIHAAKQEETDDVAHPENPAPTDVPPAPPADDQVPTVAPPEFDETDDAPVELPPVDNPVPESGEFDDADGDTEEAD